MRCPVVRSRLVRSAAPICTQRLQVAVVIVIVTEQDDVDRRQLSQFNRRCADALRPNDTVRTGTLRPYRIGQQVPLTGLYQERRMTDECKHDARGIRRRWLDHHLVTRFGHGVRRDSNILGTALNGCSCGPVGLKKCRPSQMIALHVARRGSIFVHFQRAERRTPLCKRSAIGVVSDVSRRWFSPQERCHR